MVRGNYKTTQSYYFIVSAYNSSFHYFGEEVADAQILVDTQHTHKEQRIEL